MSAETIGEVHDLRYGSVGITRGAARAMLAVLRRLEPSQPPPLPLGDGVTRPSDDEAIAALTSIMISMRNSLGRQDMAVEEIESGARALIRAVAPQACLVCGCTDHDCGWCMTETGEPCRWVEPGLCSRCADEGRS